MEGLKQELMKWKTNQTVDLISKKKKLILRKRSISEEIHKKIGISQEKRNNYSMDF